MRKLTLNRDALTELGPDDLRNLAAGHAAATQQCVSKVIGCNTADSWCELTQACG